MNAHDDRQVDSAPHSRAGMSRWRRRASWALQLLAASVLAQTLFFKFTGAPEARHIFSTLGVEPWGRWGTGLAEALAVVLLLVPGAAPIGALLAIGLMVGAIGAHLGPLGIEVMDDSGLLFGLAWTTLFAGIGVLVLRRAELPRIIGRWAGRADASPGSRN